MSNEKFSYEMACGNDLLDPIFPMIDQGYLRINKETARLESGRVIEPKSPWVFSGSQKGFDAGNRLFCDLWFLWSRIYNFIPRHCMNCWKITFHPRNLKETILTWEVQQEMNLPSKVGMELRKYVPGLWSAFWYANEEELPVEARLLRKEVERKVLEVLPVSTTKIILKRGCTEMEHRFGPSNAWKSAPQADKVEDELNALFDWNETYYPQPENLKVNILRSWVEYAWANGDQSVWEYADKASFPPSVVTYNEGT